MVVVAVVVMTVLVVAVALVVAVVSVVVAMLVVSVLQRIQVGLVPVQGWARYENFPNMRLDIVV